MNDRHEHLDEGTIHAWLDGALSPDESARVEAASNSCTECSALVAEARGLIAASSRILSSLDTVPAGVIPGTSGNVDQLAALRARHSTKKRNWWNDRRIAAAASIVFVAGISTMVWRSAPESAKSLVADRPVEAAQPAGGNAAPGAEAPAEAAPAPMVDAASQLREAPARTVKSEATASPSAPPPAATRSVDTVERKVAATTPVARGAAANEAKQVESSIADLSRQAEARRELPRADVLSPVQQQSLRQQGAAGQQQGAVGQQQGFQQLRPDTMRVNAPAPTYGSRSRTAPAVMGAVADAAALAPMCFRIQAVPPVPDSIRLFHEQLQILSDPTMYRAEYFGRSGQPVDLYWMRRDSVTVEVRARSADSVGVLFTTNNTVAEPGRGRGVRVVTAARIDCP